MMKILVTGGAGYIGSTLVPMLLAQGCRVRVLDKLMYDGRSLLGVWSHPAFEFWRGDICEPDVARAAVANMNAVVHLAAIVGDPACARDPGLAEAVNLKASMVLIEESRRAGVSRFVFASTCSNYGKMTDHGGYIDENTELRPVSLYAETKVTVERVLLDPAQTGSLCATPLRFATVFGVAPRMRFDLTVNEFTMEMLTKGRLVVFGEQFWRPYIHVRDAARAIQSALCAPTATVRNQVFNVGSTEQNYQKRQLVELIKPLAPEALVEYVHKDEDPRDYRVSFERIGGRLGFQVTRSVPDGIAEVAQLVRSSLITDFSSASYRN
jgi:nucleoside-diphosphate-sugar epimerase